MLLYRALNIAALSMRKQKLTKARNLVRGVICDVAPMFSISDAMNHYLEKGNLFERVLNKVF